MNDRELIIRWIACPNDRIYIIIIIILLVDTCKASPGEATLMHGCDIRHTTIFRECACVVNIDLRNKYLNSSHTSNRTTIHF